MTLREALQRIAELEADRKTLLSERGKLQDSLEREVADGKIAEDKCAELESQIADLKQRSGALVNLEVPIPALIRCPECHKRHIDEGEFATKPHHTHACQYCGAVWRDTLVPTVGVQFLPGFKNER